MAPGYSARSISWPSRTHPTTSKLEEQLINLEQWKNVSFRSNSQSIFEALCGLEDLYASMDQLVAMASTQKLFSNYQKRSSFNELLDESLQLLDICSNGRDLIAQTKDSCRALCSSFRRSNGDSAAIKSSVASFVCFRKTTKKEAKRLITKTKQMEEKLGHLHQLHLSSAMFLLQKVWLISASTFQCFFFFFFLVSRKQTAWPKLVRKWMQKGVIPVGCEEKEEAENELENIDAVLRNLGEDVELETIEIAKRRLEDLELRCEDIEKRLESVFRGLIRTRASLLNILSL